MPEGYMLTDRLRILPGGAALIVPEKVLVVADMHLGCEAVLEEEGLSLPRVQTSRLRQHMDQLIDSVRPSRLVVAGDLKHNFSRNLAQEWDDVVRFIQGLGGRVSLEVVKGNHDNFLISILREHDIPFVAEADVSGVRVIHGHEGRYDGRPTVMGHLHPSLSLRDSAGARVKYSCFLHSEGRRVLVLPALSIVAPGADVLHSPALEGMSPLLSDMSLESFRPIAFSGRRPLKFPTVKEMRNTKGV